MIQRCEWRSDTRLCTGSIDNMQILLTERAVRAGRPSLVSYTCGNAREISHYLEQVRLLFSLSVASAAHFSADRIVSAFSAATLNDAAIEVILHTPPCVLSRQTLSCPVLGSCYGHAVISL